MSKTDAVWCLSLVYENTWPIWRERFVLKNDEKEKEERKIERAENGGIQWYDWNWTPLVRLKSNGAIGMVEKDEREREKKNKERERKKERKKET